MCINEAAAALAPDKYHKSTFSCGRLSILPLTRSNQRSSSPGRNSLASLDLRDEH